MINPFIQSKELNTLADRLIMTSPDFKTYQENFQNHCSALGLEPPTSKQLRRNYENNLERYERQEEQIVYAASHLVSQNDHLTITNEKKAEIGLNDIGENIAKGPHLTVLDGGPGAGKSFSLGKAMQAMEAPVICLGATSSAAAGLHKDMADINSDLVFGKLTVDQFLNPKTAEEKATRAQIDTLFHKNPAPVIMVDEAGLLGHKEMTGILNYAGAMGVKLILAGDSQQIPPEKGQPFKMLTESLKDTPAYVNAPYVFRQGDFIDKAITSGVYHGFSSDEMKITQQDAIEFMVAAYDVGDPKNKEGTFTFKQHMKNFMKENGYADENSPIDKTQAVTLYIEQLASKSEMFFGGSKEAMLEALQKGAKNELDENGNNQYDKYVCAALMCQSMGMQAYELRGRTSTENNVIDSVTKDFAENYPRNLGEKQFADGKLAITATKEEAKALNDSIRHAMGKPDTLTVGEPIILSSGKCVIATEKDVKNPPEGFEFAYALDVTTTQGMSQKGKVTMIVNKETQNNWQGGEILVGATRHKGDFELKLADGVDKNAFYENSTHQFAAARVLSNPFNKKVYVKAGGKEEIAEQKEKISAENKKEVVQQKDKADKQSIHSTLTKTQEQIQEKGQKAEQKNAMTVQQIKRQNIHD